MVGYGNSPELQVSLMVSFNGYKMNQSPHDPLTDQEMSDIAVLNRDEKHDWY